MQLKPETVPKLAMNINNKAWKSNASQYINLSILFFILKISWINSLSWGITRTISFLKQAQYNNKQNWCFSIDLFYKMNGIPFFIH